MVNLRRVEDRPTPKAVYNWRVWSLASTAACASMVIGYDSAFIGGTMALKSFTNEFGTLSATTSANVVSTYQAGAFFGSLFGYPLGYFFGRKWGLFVAAAIFCVASAIMCAASHHTGLGPMYAGRVLAGAAIGSASNLAPMYIAEIAPSSIRGQLVGLYELGWQIGGIVGFWINFGVDRNMVPSHRQWLIPFAIQLVPGGLLLIGSLTLIESPRWLLEHGDKEDAIRNLCKIRNLPPSHTYIIEEISAMETQLEHERALVGTSFWGPFRETFMVGNIFKRVLLGSSLFAFQNGAGINAVNYYSPTIFRSIGITGTSTSLLTTGVFGIIKTIGAVIWILFFIDHFGRRIILMTGATGGAISMFWIGAYIKIADVKHKHATDGLKGGGISALVAFYLWTIFYSTSWNGTPWVVGAEIFPQQSRTVGQACMAASNWLYNFAIARATPQMFAKMDYGVYIFFGSLMVLAVPYVYFVLPETKGIPLEAMDELFDAPVPNRKAHGWMVERLGDRSHAHAHGGREDGGSSPEEEIVNEKMYAEERRSESVALGQV